MEIKMNSIYFKIFKRSFLLTTFIIAIAGCGSSSSNSLTANNGTGSITAKLSWGSPNAITTAKTLYKAPDGVARIQIVVLDSNRFSLGSGDFAASLGAGTVDNIPVGSGYYVEVRGLDSKSVMIYENIVKNVTINVGVNDLGVIKMAPITTANPLGGSYTMPFDLKLTSSVPATIYYTTNGDDPTTSSRRETGTNQLTFSIYSSPTTVKFFSFINYSTREVTKTEIYRKL
ncbi:MAG: hypothetical protein CVU66_00185 [Deltaproteobacteria bacterium HGW-Deltaproteobacteria-23]|nr:MAG: hypothetical protein CVU66_00185 [Deltaproteobacteria bacterium HGW-Deltaproteobacteria-23]